jgi:hypothetical protein
MIVDTIYTTMIVALNVMLISVFLLITYAVLSSLWYSLASCFERMRDYLGKVNKS